MVFENKQKLLMSMVKNKLKPFNLKSDEQQMEISATNEIG